jgi:hypothetical protein
LTIKFLIAGQGRPKLIPYLGVHATGTDPAVAATQVMVGRAPDTSPRHRSTAGIRFLYPTEDCEVVSAAIREDRLGPGIHQAVATAAPGTRLALPPRGYMSRYGYVIATGDNSAQVAADLTDAEELIDLRFRPLAE